ncbi:MAG: GAF domain-containing protein [Verrucomicrobiota bacterium]
MLPFLSVTLALGLRQLLDPVLGDSFAYLLIYPAVLVAGWFGGIRSALIVLALGLLGGRLFFVQPRSTFVFTEPTHWTGAISFITIGLMITGLAEALRRARARVDKAAAEFHAQQRRLEKEAAERRELEKFLRTQYQVNAVLAEAPSVDEALPRIMATVCESTHWEIAASWTMDAAAGRLRCGQIWQRPGAQFPNFLEATRRFTFTRGDGLPGRIWSSGAPAWIMDVTQDANFPRARFAAEDGLHGAFGFPILFENEVLGVIEFFSRETRAPDKALLDMTGAIGTKLGQFIRRKRAEQALRESERSVVEAHARIKEVLTSITEAYFVLDEHYRFLEVNPMTEKLLGKPAAEMIGRGFWDVFPQGRDSDFYREYHRAMEEGRPVHFEGRSHIVDRWFEAHAYPRGNRLEVYFRDITERKKQEDKITQLNQELSRRVREFQTLIDTIPIGIGVATDPECQNIWVNPEFAKVLGISVRENASYSQPEAERLPFRIFRDGKLLRAEELPMQYAASHCQQIRGVEVDVVTSDGRQTKLLCSASPVLDESGQVRGCIGAVLDVTEHKEAERELEARARQLAAVAELSQLALTEIDWRGLMNEAVSLVARTLDVEFAAILELLPNQGEFVLRAGVGWKAGHIGKSRISADRSTQPGYTLQVSQPIRGETKALLDPILVEDLKTERRFSGPTLFHEHGILSGMSVVVPGAGRPFGVLGAHSASRRRFLRNEAEFLQTIANVLTAAFHHRHAEESVRESEARLRTAMDAGKLGAWEWDIVSDHITWTDRIYEFHGLEPGHFRGTVEAFSALVHPKDRPRVMLAVRKALEERAPYELDFRTVRPNGDVRWLSTRAQVICDNSGKPVRMVGITSDQTDRKDAERQLIERANQQQQLYELTSIISRANALSEIYDAAISAILASIGADRASILLYDADQVMRFKAWHGLSEKYRAAVEGHSPWKPDTPNPQPIWIEDVATVELDETLRQVVLGEGIRALAFIPLVYSGRLLGKFMLYYNAPRPRVDQELQLSQTIARQVAIAIERKKSDQALHEAQEKLKNYAADLERRVADRTAKLQETIRFLESFCYSIAHDLRAPLRALHGFTKVIMEDYAPHFDAEGFEMARRIVCAADRMDRLIQDLLAFARLGHAEMSLRPIDLEERLHIVLAHLADEIASRQACVELVKPLPAVLANASVLEELLSNLLANALKFVSPGVHPRVRIWAEKRDGNVILSMEDNGIGIAPEHQEKIFRVFERLHSNESYPGTGIGLAIVQKGVERMGGRVGVESQLGKGSRFWIELPFAENDAPA